MHKLCSSPVHLQFSHDLGDRVHDRFSGKWLVGFSRSVIRFDCPCYPVRSLEIRARGFAVVSSCSFSASRSLVFRIIKFSFVKLDLQSVRSLHTLRVFVCLTANVYQNFALYHSGCQCIIACKILCTTFWS